MVMPLVPDAELIKARTHAAFLIRHAVGTTISDALGTSARHSHASRDATMQT
jgi:hypothetical protein